MSQLPRFSRARRLTASVWSGKAADDYGSLVAARLRKLAAAGSTGTLPFSGAGAGAIYFRDGAVVLAKSTRTPSPSAAGDGAAAGEPAAPGAAGTPFTRLVTALAVAEPTVDATVELVSSESRFTKFRSAKAPVSATGPGIDVEDLLTELARRQHILHQLAPVVTADTVVARNPYLSAPDISVLAPQWALLIRVRDGSTPRALAWELGRSVFGTTLEVYRLLALRLLSSAAHRTHHHGQEPRYGPATMSFVRAVSPERGSPQPEGVAAGAGDSTTVGSSE
jgi:hypothetical protein